MTTARRDDPSDLESATDAGALGPLHAYVGYVLRRAQIAVFQDFIRTLAGVDLRPAQFSVLTLIDANPGIVQSRACSALGIQKANFVPMLQELEKRGLTRRVPVDGRSNGVFLTAKGRALLKRARSLHDRHHARITKLIGEPEQRRLIATLDRLATLGE
ncbi:MAG: MarR family transcriptional regulator [Candidatus Eremiobacteraeota bacterium]|nr:MarR family transcriptional regulator [Candidatus Eremiobacteraeota bacterium]